MRQKPSIHDVAQEAGVSIATVSRVINRLTRVSAQTRQRVEQAMEHLRYRPNPRARALSLKCTETLGLVLPDLYGDYFGDLMRGVDARAREVGRLMIVARAEGPEDEKRFLERLLGGGRVDGLILMISDRSDWILEEVDDLPGPLVVLDKDVGHRHVDNILVDNRTGARDATEHLIIAHGLTDLIFLGGPEDNIDTRDRASGFRDALTAAGCPPRDDQLCFGAYNCESGYHMAQSLIGRLSRGRSGLVAANDDLAWGAIDALNQAGLRVPEDVAVVGFDDSRLARLTRPALTSVRVPLREIGCQAVDMIMDHLSGRRTRSTKTMIRGRLIVRSSCGCQSSQPMSGGKDQ